MFKIKKGMQIYSLIIGMMLALTLTGCRQQMVKETGSTVTVPVTQEQEQTAEKPEAEEPSTEPEKPEQETPSAELEQPEVEEPAEKPAENPTEAAGTDEKAEPEQPSEQETPAEPEAPSEPETPIEPKVPIEPEAPSEPETAIEPEIPAEPEIPVEPELTEAEKIELAAKRTTMRPTLSYIGSVIRYYFLEDVDTELLVEQALEQVSLESTLDDAIKVMVAGLNDPYSAYFAAQEYKNEVDSNTGNYCGIGATVQKDETTGGIRIVEPFRNGPAEKAGLKTDDLILAIDGVDVTGMDLDAAINYVKGEQGTAVELTILRGKKKKNVIVYRDFVTEITVTSELKEASIGYIKLSKFEEVSVEQFNSAVEELSAAGMESLIIDLRNNPGGLLSSVTRILERILPEGKLITYTEDKHGNRESLYTNDSDRIDMPIVVLVNGNSASASELFTGAVQDYSVATIVGENTFGKGIVQSYLQFTDGSALKLTTSKYYTPSGVCIHKTGILPDYVLANEKEGADEQQEFALELLR